MTGVDITAGLNLKFQKVGAVAQLGERVNGIHEVRGSTPLSSTSFLYGFSDQLLRSPLP